jgi:hypothetical protein
MNDNHRIFNMDSNLHRFSMPMIEHNEIDWHAFESDQSNVRLVRVRILFCILLGYIVGTNIFSFFINTQYSPQKFQMRSIKSTSLQNLLDMHEVYLRQELPVAILL